MAVLLASDASYELQTSPNAVQWTTVAEASGLNGQTVRTLLPGTATQWLRIVAAALKLDASFCLDFGDHCFNERRI